MDRDTLGGYPNIKSFVEHKIDLLKNSDRDMCALYSLMFSESENVIAEKTDGFRINKLTYGDCKLATDKISKQLSKLLSDVKKSSLIGIYMDNSIEFIEVFWAVLQAGYKPLLMNMLLPDEVLNKVIADYNVAAVISSEKIFSTLTLTFDDIKKTEIHEDISLNSFENEMYFMSSNTTGNLKICGYTGEQFYYQIQNSVAIVNDCKSICRPSNGDIKLLTFLPFYHVFGFMAVYIWFCFFSRTLVFMKNNEPKTITQTVRKHRVTHIFAVPLFWETIYKSAMFAVKERGEETYKKFQKGLRIEKKLSLIPFLGKFFAKKVFKEVRANIFGESVVFMISGGGHITADTLEFMNGIGYCLVNGYGMTELGITSVELSERPKERILGSVGMPFVSMEYKINEHGELLVKGKSIAATVYLNGKKNNLSSDEWFNTHDIFTCRNGKYFIEGRKDDLIICSNGENINPLYYEDKIIVDGAERVCLIPFGKGRAAVIAQVHRYADMKRLLRLRDDIKAKVSEQRLDAVVEKIILTKSPLLEENDFKLNRKKICERLSLNALKIIDLNEVETIADEFDRELIERITELFAKALNKDKSEIAYDAHFFFDLGGSSLDYFSMISSIQSEFSVSFPSTEDTAYYSVRDMTGYIKNKLNH